MKRPWFKFHTADWQGNAKLRRCTHKEKGIWIDVLCLLHDSDEYGIVRWPLRDIAEAAGCSVADLKALINKDILKGADAGEVVEEFSFAPTLGRKKGDSVTLIPSQEGPLWYSSRMVVDEHKANQRGGKNDAPKPALNPPFSAANNRTKPPLHDTENMHGSMHSPRARVSEPEPEPDKNPHTQGGPAPAKQHDNPLADTLGSVKDWTPDPVQLAAALRRAGIPQPTPERIELHLSDFRNHYATHRLMTDAQYLDKFRNWIGRARHDDNHTQTGAGAAAGQPAARKLTPVEQAERDRDQFLRDNGIDPASAGVRR